MNTKDTLPKEKFTAEFTHGVKSGSLKDTVTPEYDYGGFDWGRLFFSILLVSAIPLAVVYACFLTGQSRDAFIMGCLGSMIISILMRPRI